MRIYLMTDLEGVCGVTNFEDWCTPASRYYEKAKDLLTREVNAAVEGFLEGGADGVTVADGHGHGAIDSTTIHARAELMRGWPKVWPFALDEGDYDAIAWVGQHAKSGTIQGHLCHTGSFVCRDISVNGLSVGEFGRLALCASELRIPVIFACGDEAFAREAQALVPGVETVAVKRGVNTEPGHHLPAEAYSKLNTAAVHLSTEEARSRIRAGAKKAVERARDKDFGIIGLKPPYEMVAVYRSDATNPPRVSRTQHPKSVIELFRLPLQLEAIEKADPLTLI